MEKSKRLDSFCNNCQSSAVTNERIKKSFDYICYLDNLINGGGGGEGGVTNAEYNEDTGVLTITFLDGSQKEVEIPSANGLIPVESIGGGTSWVLKEVDQSNAQPMGRGSINLNSYPTNEDEYIKSIYSVVFCDSLNKVEGFRGDTGSSHFVSGYDNTVQSVYGAHVFGVYNKVVDGQTSVAIGWNNDIQVTVQVPPSGIALGSYNNLRGYNVHTIGNGLIAKTKGLVVVGEGNTDYPSTGAQDPNRPIFIVGVGYMSVNRGSFGTVTERKDGLVVRKTGIVEAPELTITQFNNDTTGKILVTKEVLEDQLSGGDDIPLIPEPNQEYPYKGEGFYQRVIIELTGSRQQQFNKQVSTDINKILKIEVSHIENNAIENMDSLNSLSNSFSSSDKPTYTLMTLSNNGTTFISLNSQVLSNASTTEVYSGQIVNIDLYYTKN